MSLFHIMSFISTITADKIYGCVCECVCVCLCVHIHDKNQTFYFQLLG